MSHQAAVRRRLVLCDMHQSVNEQTARSRICLKQNWSLYIYRWVRETGTFTAPSAEGPVGEHR